MKHFLISVFVFFTSYLFSQSCTHTIQRTDTWGDGWNGGLVSVSVNGVTVLTNLSCTGAGPTSSNFTATAGQVIRVWRTSAGSYPYEMRIRVISSSGAVVINTIEPVAGTATSGGRIGTASCGTPPPPGSCTNTSPYMVATMPSTPGLFYVSTCTFQSEYTTFNSVVAGRQYRSTYSLGGWITVRHTTPGGTVVASGASPLTWTAPISGTYYVHYNTNSGCGVAYSCGTDYIECLSCVAVPPPANDLVCNATAIGCGQTLAGTTSAATNSGIGENSFCSVSQTQPGVWYVIPGNGQIMTANLCNTAWDSKISVFSGPNCSSLTCVGGNDDWGPACSSSSASFTWTSTAGTNYYILVHGYSSNSSFNLGLACVSPPPPNPTSLTTASNTICNGSPTTLTANGAVGVVYWYTNGCGSNFVSTGNTISVSPASTTTYYARNLNNGLFSGCAQITITVNPQPVVSVSAVTSTICEGSTTQLISQVSGVGSPTYLWSPSNGLSNTSAASPMASPITTQTYTLTVTQSNCSSTAQSTVTVNPSVSNVSQISGNNTIIAGTSETYSITPVANVTYQWAYTESITSPLWINVPNSNSSSITFTWPQTTTDGSARVICSNASGCGTQTRFFNIVVNGALPVELLSFNGTCDDGLISLIWKTASEYNSDYFEVIKSRDGLKWSNLTTLNSANNSTQELTYQTMDKNGIDGNNYYKLIQYDIDGQSKEYGPINVICNGNSNGYFSTFPNPSSGSFQVVVNDKNMIGSGILVIKDTKGSDVLSMDIEIVSGINLFNILKNDLTEGVYYVSILSNGLSTKIIKQVISNSNR